MVNPQVGKHLADVFDFVELHLIKLRRLMAQETRQKCFSEPQNHLEEFVIQFEQEASAPGLADHVGLQQFD